MSALLIPSILGNVTFINNFLSSVGVLVSIFPQLLQNGNSPLGLLPSPALPPFLGGSQGVPWGNRSAGTTNAYEDPPDTGVVREYTFDVKRGTLAPDGIETSLLLVNGQFPGPTIEANWGDTIRVTMTNLIEGPAEGTALHWHGLLQKKTPWYDGVPGISMCPIAPGKTFVYEFIADLYGTSWYHSHYSAQYAGGIFGAMVIHGPTDNFPKDAGEVLDLGPIMLSDFIHRDYYEVVQQDVGNNPVAAALIISENTLIQGKGNTDCSDVPAGTNCTTEASLAKFSFTKGRTHRLRLINTSAAGFMVVSLDSHMMTVVANDFVPIKPYQTTQVQLFVGQRVDILVTADQVPGAYWFRVRQPTLCALSSQPFALAAVYYGNTPTTTKPDSLPHLEFLEPSLINCGNDPLSVTEPYYPIGAINPPDQTLHISITQAVNATGHTHYLMNGSPFMADYNTPLLNASFTASTLSEEVPSWAPQSNVYVLKNITNIIFQNNVPFGHPMHVHGQNMYILDEGVGEYPGTLNVVRSQNPMRRDTQSLKPNGYLVVQLRGTNSGIWPFHCHIAWHVSQGLYINIVQDLKGIKERTQIPGVMRESCDDWNQVRPSQILPEIDSGVRLKDKKVKKSFVEDTTFL